MLMVYTYNNVNTKRYSLVVIINRFHILFLNHEKYTEL